LEQGGGRDEVEGEVEEAAVGRKSDHGM